LRPAQGSCDCLLLAFKILLFAVVTGIVIFHDHHPP